MNFGSLFSGIGGFDLGFERAGHECAWQVEIDESCQRVLCSRFQREPAGRSAANGHLAPAHNGRGQAGAGLSGGPDLHANVTQVGARNLTAVDLICGGFPCQDLSVAGKRAGLAGGRSSLWFEFHRILAELRPRWVVIENVPGLLSSRGGADMAVVLGGLAELGYGWAYRVLNAQHFGVAQRRRRVFIVGNLGSAARAAAVLFEPESVSGNPPACGRPGQGVAGTLGGGSGERGWPQDTERMTFLPVSPDGEDIMRSVSAVTHSLSSEGADASEDGTGRGTPLVVGALASQQGPRGHGGSGLASAQSVAAGHVVAAYPLAMRGRADGAELEMGEEGTYNALRAGDGGSSRANNVLAGAAVRRLTPTECERLQGFPDGWTESQSDSTRYRQLGNAVAVPVAEWIGKRLTQPSEPFSSDAAVLQGTAAPFSSQQ